jgi:hypothetical protein
MCSAHSNGDQTWPAERFERSALARPQIIFAGHSHLHAFLGVENSDQPKSALVVINNDILAVAGPGGRTQDYWDLLCEEAEGRIVVLLWGGNEHNSFFLFEGDRPFDVFLTESDRIEDGRELIPQRAVRAKYDPALEGLRYVLDRLSTKKCRVIVGGTPPPQRDNEKVFARAQNEPDFRRLMIASGLPLERVKISPPFLRLKMWRLLQTCVRETAIHFGAEYFAVPSRLTDADGYLLECYLAGDLSHANSDYALIYMEDLLNWI